MGTKILITGGSGYLGQFAVVELARLGFQVFYTFGNNPLPALANGPIGIKVDLSRYDSVGTAFLQHGPFHTVINCAAISQPALCEKEPDIARAVNVPVHLITCLKHQKEADGIEALLVHLSTDQVYDGSRADWTEDEVCEPVNTYGRSKLEAERYIQGNWPYHVILRSSIIYGPPPPAAPVGRALFLQFMDNVLREGKSTSFFEDEYRSPVYVGDILRVLTLLVGRPTGDTGTLKRKLYCMGGPERLSRVDMARKVAEVRGWSQDAIQPVPAASVARGVASPPDISMVSKHLEEDLLAPQGSTSFTKALKIIFQDSPAS